MAAFHGLRPRQVQPARWGCAWRRPGPGAIPSLLNGPLRREARSPGPWVANRGGSQARPAARRRLPCRRVDPRDALQGRRPRVRPHGERTRRSCGNLIDRAIRIALPRRRTVTCLIVPKRPSPPMEAEEPQHEHGTVHSSGRLLAAADPPHRPANLAAAAEILNEGRGASRFFWPARAHSAPGRRGGPRSRKRLGAGPSPRRCSAGARCARRPAVPWTGSIGLPGHAPRAWELMQGCDTPADGRASSFPYSEFLPEEGKARRGGRSTSIRAMIGIRYPMDVHLVGDARRDAARAAAAAARGEERSLLAGADRGRTSPTGGS